MAEQKQIQELKPEEKEQLIKFFKDLDSETLKATANAIRMMVNAFEGRPVDEQDIITRLVNVRNILERSNFPTYPILQSQVYRRLIAQIHPEAKSWKYWADLDAEGLTSYKALSRENYVDMVKGTVQPPEQIIVGDYQQPQVQQQKRSLIDRILRRNRNQPSEFEHQ